MWTTIFSVMSCLNVCQTKIFCVMSCLNVHQTNEVLGFNFSVRHDPFELMDMLLGDEVRQKNKKI